MRTAIHPDRRLLLLHVQVAVPGDDLLRRLIDFGHMRSAESGPSSE
jgi:hypothetical protein